VRFDSEFVQLIFLHPDLTQLPGDAYLSAQLLYGFYRFIRSGILIHPLGACTQPAQILSFFQAD